jgi:hypothetical protein
MTEMLEALTKAIAARSLELADVPKEVLHAELARTAVETMKSPTDRMMRIGESFSDFILPEGFCNDAIGRAEHLKIAYAAALDAALEDPLPGVEIPRNGGRRNLIRKDS